MNLTSNSTIVKQAAAALGFSHCGIARAQRLDDHAARLEAWLNAGMHGTMNYMENHFELRVDPTKLVPGARSVITLLFNYFPGEESTAGPSISKYAYGEDYHEVIRPKLRQLLEVLRTHFGDIQGRGFVDSAPVLERAWAERSGLGWIGKNANLLTRQGSFFFIATLITDLELDPDPGGHTDHCGTCTKCIDSCPTEAILPGRVVDGSKCISYFTIELKDALIPGSMKGQFGNWMFGCDVCQDVCPWNSFATPHNHDELKPIPEILNFTTKEWEELTEEQFKIIFKNSPLKRSKFAGIKRNLRFIQQ